MDFEKSLNVKLNKGKYDTVVSDVLKKYGSEKQDAFFGRAADTCLAALTYYCLENGVDLNNMEAVKELANSGIKLNPDTVSELEKKFEKAEEEIPNASCLVLYRQFLATPTKTRNVILQGVAIRISEVNRKEKKHETEKQ